MNFAAAVTLVQSPSGLIYNLTDPAGVQPHGPSRVVESVFLRNGRYAPHVALWSRPLLSYFGEEMFKSRGSDIDEHADWLIRIIFETVDRAAGGINAIAREQVGPSTVH